LSAPDGQGLRPAVYPIPQLTIKSEIVLILAEGCCKQASLKLHYSYIVSESREKEVGGSEVQRFRVQRFRVLGSEV